MILAINGNHILFGIMAIVMLLCIPAFFNQKPNMSGVAPDTGQSWKNKFDDSRVRIIRTKSANVKNEYFVVYVKEGEPNPITLLSNLFQNQYDYIGTSA